MASGLPDYYRGVDVAYQALSQMIVRPKYGAAKRVSAAGIVDADVLTLIVSVSGRGMIYGGAVSTFDTVTQEWGAPVLHIDGDMVSMDNFYGLIRFNNVKTNSQPFYLLKFDNVNFIYSAGISSGLTFETGFEVKYQESNGNTPYVSAKVFYALI